MRVLMVENQLSDARAIGRALADSHLTADIAETGEDALEMVRHYDYDIVVLASALPDMEGVDVLRRLRAGRGTVPVIMVGVPGRGDARLRAFAAGADDVLSGAFDAEEFVARLRAIVRRCRGFSNSELQVGNLTLHMEAREVYVNDKPVHLTGKEYAILELLVMRRGMVLTKDAFLSHLYGGLDEPEMKIIDVFICKLRKKLALAGADNLITTLWGRGYMLRDDSKPATTATPARAIAIAA